MNINAYSVSCNMIKFCFILIVFFVSCNKFVAVDPPINKITGENVFESDATAAAVLTGMYADISKVQYFENSSGVTSLSRYLGLSSDELILWSGAFNSSSIFNLNQENFYKNNLYVDYVSVGSGSGHLFYSNFYKYIFICNSVFEALEGNTNLSIGVKKQILGEARFMRAMYFFYLVNLYGDVPLVLTTDYKLNQFLGRTSSAIVYDQIVNDLKEAKLLLGDFYVDGSLLRATSERTRPNKWVATALLSRVYLYKGDYINAEICANEVIGNTSLFGLTNINSVFQKNSREAIWQLQPVTAGWNTEDGRLFVLPSSGPNSSNTVYLSEKLYSSFESLDARKSNWISSVTVAGVKYYFPFKYKNSSVNSSVTEYLMMFRLGEQYLIRAEARANLGKLVGQNSASSDVDSIRIRASLPPIVFTSKEGILRAIIKERQLEMFTELGHRWFDLNRVNIIDSVMEEVTPTKVNGASWRSYQRLLPLPYADLLKNENLKQNYLY